MNDLADVIIMIVLILGTRSHLALGHTWHSVTLVTRSYLALGHTWHSVTLGTRSFGTQSQHQTLDLCRGTLEANQVAFREEM